MEQLKDPGCSFSENPLPVLKNPKKTVLDMADFEGGIVHWMSVIRLVSYFDNVQEAVHL